MRKASLASLLAALTFAAACASNISGSGGEGTTPSSSLGTTGGAATTATTSATATTSSTVVTATTSTTTTTSATSATSGCEQGVACATPGFFCAGSSTSCTASCTCDATGHWDCTLKTDAPACPAVHAACGAACDATLGGFSCMCTGGSLALTPCSCESGAWHCTPPPDPAHPCPALGRCGRGRTCADFPEGLVCDIGECTCRAMCGTQLWDCGNGP
jgi:hypothetical protein